MKGGTYMCTCITMKTRDVYFGRTMDLHYRFGEQVAVTPRNYRVPLKSGDSFETWYAMIGMATAKGGYPLRPPTRRASPWPDSTSRKTLGTASRFPGNETLPPMSSYSGCWAPSPR